MESLSRDLIALAQDIGLELPSLFTLLICLVIVLVRRKKHPRVSLLAALGLILLILHSLVFAVAAIWLPGFFIDGGYAERETFHTIYGLVASVSLGIAFGLLLIAIFIDRKPAALYSDNPGITWEVTTRRVG